MEAAVRWSPHSSGGRERFLVVDVADQSLTLNQISSRTRDTVHFHPVARHGRLPNFGAVDWSKTDESIVALGLVSGSACLIKLNEHDRASETVATYKSRQQRKCNSIALSSQDWLAVALDRTRSDACLNIYDASNHHESNQDPVRRLCPAEMVSSVRFCPSQPQELIVAAQRSFIRLYDLRDGYFGRGSSAQAATRNVNNIAIDPLDVNYFASAGSTGDPNVTVWDRRWISQTASDASITGAVFDFHPAVDNSYTTSVWSMRYSGQQRGRLALCSSRGELRVLDMTMGGTSFLYGSQYLPSNPHGGQPWSHNHYVSQTRHVQRPFEEGPDLEPNAEKLIAFDWMTGDWQSPEQNVLALRPSRRVDVLRVPRVPSSATVTARHDLSMAYEHIAMVESKLPSEPGARQTVDEHHRTAEDFGPSQYEGEARDGGDVDGRISCKPDSPRLAGMLAESTLPRERCRRGYLWDCAKNAEIVVGNWQLERLWEIVHRFQQQAAQGGMVSESHGLDLSFVGVLAVCSRGVGPNPNRRLSASPGSLDDAVADLATTRELPPFVGERTHFPENRQLALEMCGWKFSQDTLEAECQELIERGLYYQAVVQAVLHEYKHTALNLLRSMIRSKTVPNIGLGALLASDRINKEQREMCMWMAADTDDPALKALLAFLTTGDWRDVMKTNYLHLGYRVALGLQYLNDTELKGFLESEAARAIKNGDLEGILITGLGEQAMDLIQAYITRTNDLQSAVLATAFTNPRYVDDSRWDMWKETYFMQMQSWRLFTERSRFIVQHSQLAKKKKSAPPLPDVRSGQITLRCNHCQLSLARHPHPSLAGTRGDAAPPPSNVKGSVALSASAGVVCPQCGRHMPRCGICQMWLGSPDANRSGGARELQKMDDVMAKFLTFCVSCEHGFHADHARLWFKKHETCPVPDCRCLCMVK